MISLVEINHTKKAKFQNTDELDYNKYTIEINSLEELQALIDEVGGNNH